MVIGKTGEVDLLNDRQNDIRSNLIQLVSKLYKKFSLKQSSVEIQFEDKIMLYHEGVLELKGCIDIITAAGPSCSDVILGKKIKTYGHLPHSWLVGLL